ncbi:hypothetical protein [Agathobacter rectalis]|uniref:hypothetical protein n=1 Tax=Agathobacter rectalis TaxID=39491 RepID=UPI0027F9A37A|nr:hypothetical protein [Agathobacter rectalis]
MKKRTNLLALVLSITAITFTLLGCSSDTGPKKSIAVPGSATETGGGGADQASADESINEQVLVDQDGIKITATEYVTDSIWGDGIKLLVENNSANDYTIGCDALIVNDYMITDLFSADVAAGKKSNEVMYLSSAELKAAGIDTVGQIEMYFHAYDSNWDNLFKNVYSKLETSEFANMDTTPNDEGQELYNANGVRIVGKTVDENSFWGTAILLYIENTSGQNVGINVDNMSINGYMMTPLFSTTVYDGKKSIDDITIMSSDLEANGITSVDQVELKFHIYNAESYDTIADSDAITFTAQ